MNRTRIILALALFGLFSHAISSQAQPEIPASQTVNKIEDIVIYADERFHSAFPSVVKRPNGELIVAFRRAPERRIFGETSTSHTDPNSYLVLVRSRDNGKTWSREPELLFAHPFGGSQDPCLLQLRDNSLLCASYGWALIKTNAIAKLRSPTMRHGEFVFMGGYLLRSRNGGASWDGPMIPPPVAAGDTYNVFGQPTPAYNRGAMVEDKNGKIYWAVAVSRPGNTDPATTRLKLHTASGTVPRKTETHLLISSDRGNTWEYSCPIAQDDQVTFNETSLYLTPKGNLVAFMRTANFNDHTTVARSTDGGKSFQPWQDAGFKGHPHHALRLPDNRVLLTYGYRHAPLGIRARVLDPECTQLDSEEIILREDGGSTDLGYPWATMISNNRILVT